MFYALTLITDIMIQIEAKWYLVKTTGDSSINNIQDQFDLIIWGGIPPLTLSLSLSRSLQPLTHQNVKF